MAQKKIRITDADKARAALEDLRASIYQTTPEEEAHIRQWEKEIKEHELWEDWILHPITKRIYDELVLRTANITFVLSTDEDITDQQRRDIFGHKKVYKYILTLFRRGTDAQAFNRIETDIRGAIAKFEEYNR